MAWVESVSESFLCRHTSADAEDAARVLALLERTRARLADVFPRAVDGLEVVLHDRDSSLVAANPLLAVARRLTDPSARRYVYGWAGRREIHVLAPAALRARACAPAGRGAPSTAGSAAVLDLAPATLYTRRVIVECNRDLHRALPPARGLVGMRWAWLLEGASRWFGGETVRARGAVARRLREGPRPSFPPAVRDAPLLGGTVIDLLAREEGEQAAVQFACRLHPGGPQAALSKAFEGRALVHTEGAWRSHLARLAESV